MIRSSTRPVILIHGERPSDNDALCGAIAHNHPELFLVATNSDAQVAQHLPEADIVIAWNFPVNLLHVAGNLRWYQVWGAGVEALVPLASTLRQVKVTNIRGIFGTSMAEYALTYMLAHSQNIRVILQHQVARQWVPFIPTLLTGKTVGVAGLGSIGREVARYFDALSMRVIGMKRHPGDVEHVESVYLQKDIEEFLPQCDFLVLVLPHTRETQGLLTRDRLRLLKSTCFLVNMGRGSIVQEKDLVEALRCGWLAGAALDVFPSEPLASDSPLWSLENVYVTPHIAWPNRPDETIPAILENLRRFLKGEPLLYVVDLDRGY